MGAPTDPSDDLLQECRHCPTMRNAVPPPAPSDVCPVFQPALTTAHALGVCFSCGQRLALPVAGAQVVDDIRAAGDANGAQLAALRGLPPELLARVKSIVVLAGDNGQGGDRAEVRLELV